jgi:hypothetical protein
MKKLLIVFLILSVAAESYAQTFAVRGGLNLANMLMKDDDGTYSDEFKMRTGFHLGGTVEFSINDAFTFETGLLFATKGFKVEESGDKVILGTNNLDLPITVKAYLDAGKIKIYFNLGAYVGYGLSGKTKQTFNGSTEEEDIVWGSDPDTDFLKRFDFGLLGGAGIEIKSLQVGVSYGFGLANISPFTDGGAKINNRVLSVTLAYKYVRASSTE